MFKKWTALLAASELFAGIAAEELEEMLRCMNPEIKRFGKNECLALAGQVFTGIGLVLSGNVTVSKENVAGNRVILTVLEAGGMFGEMAAFSGVRVWPATVTAQGETIVIFLPPEKIVGNCPRQCRSHRQLISNMMKIISNKALILNKKLEYLSIKSVREKIGTYLLEQYRERGRTTFMLSIKRNELADFLNITRPSLSREMGRMRDEGVIDFHRASIQIKDMQALLKIVGGS